MKELVIFLPLAAWSPQGPPGPAWRDKVLADNADDPDDADEPDDLHESDNSDDSDDPLRSSWTSCPNRKKVILAPISAAQAVAQKWRIPIDGQL